MFFLIVFLMHSLPLATAGAPACFELFRAEKGYNVDVKADEVFTTQVSIGREHARRKLWLKAKIEPEKTFEELSHDELRKLDHAISELIHDELPAVIDPNGVYLIIDGHHDLYSLVLGHKKLHSSKARLKIEKDYRIGNWSKKAFIEDMVQRNWADRESLEDYKRIDQIGNNPNRSLSGMAFTRIAEKYDMKPFRGKNFIPRVQFYLVDLMVEKKLYAFDGKLDAASVEKFADFIISNETTLQFLMESLAQPVKPRLWEFLYHRHQDAIALKLQKL